MHMANYPDRSWAIILQQAWSMCLKDKIQHSNSPFGRNAGMGKNKKDICKCFNKGLCTAGHGCKYDHRCCGKFGHGVHICRNKSNPGGNMGNSASSSGSSGMGANDKQK